MNITNTRYTSLGSITALVDGVEMSIPVDTDNRHYAAILAQSIEIAPYVAPTPTYVDLRIAAYPSLQTQLDMQYWDGVNGTTVWADTIAKIKAEYPKP